MQGIPGGGRGGLLVEFEGVGGERTNYGERYLIVLGFQVEVVLRNQLFLQQRGGTGLLSYEGYLVQSVLVRRFVSIIYVQGKVAGVGMPNEFSIRVG